MLLAENHRIVRHAVNDRKGLYPDAALAQGVAAVLEPFFDRARGPRQRSAGLRDEVDQTLERFAVARKSSTSRTVSCAER